MKKLILIISLIGFVIAGFSQSTMRTRDNVNIKGSNYAFNLSVGTADSIGVSQDSVQIPIEVTYPDSVMSFFKLKLTEVTSPARIIVQHQVKRFASDSWTTSFTTTYTGVGTDSTIRFQSQAPYKSYNHQRILCIYTTNKAYISELAGWFLK